MASTDRVKVAWPYLTFDHPERPGDKVVFSALPIDQWLALLARRGWDWDLVDRRG